MKLKKKRKFGGGNKRNRATNTDRRGENGNERREPRLIDSDILKKISIDNNINNNKNDDQTTKIKNTISLKRAVFKKLIKDFKEYKKIVNKYGWFNEGAKAEKLRNILIEKEFITKHDKFKKRTFKGKKCICFTMIKNQTYPLFENEKLNPKFINDGKFNKIKWFNGEEEVIYNI